MKRALLLCLVVLGCSRPSVKPDRWPAGDDSVFSMVSKDTTAQLAIGQSKLMVSRVNDNQVCFKCGDDGLCLKKQKPPQKDIQVNFAGSYQATDAARSYVPWPECRERSLKTFAHWKKTNFRPTEVLSADCPNDVARYYSEKVPLDSLQSMFFNGNLPACIYRAFHCTDGSFDTVITLKSNQSHEISYLTYTKEGAYDAKVSEIVNCFKNKLIDANMQPTGVQIVPATFPENEAPAVREQQI